MRFRELKPRKSRTKMSVRRRFSRTDKFNRYHFYKTLINWGRIAPRRWWKK